jgi:uncharacterized protein (DUF2267 family)
VDQDEFIQVVARAAGIDRQAASRAVQATLAVLGERLGRDECRHLVTELPAELGGWLFPAGGAQRFDAVGFVERIARAEGTDPATAERHAHAVFLALGRALSDDAYAHLVSRLSRDYAPLLPKGRDAGAVPLDEFVAGIAERAGVDTDTARRAAEAVLETLAERIAGGEVEDLLSQLPIALHPALRRGASRANAATLRMPVDEFLRRVGELAGVTPAAAHVLTRAVFTTLREAVRSEFFDITDQLPGEYWELLAPRAG